jgi:3-oxoadipate enol-lactonase
LQFATVNDVILHHQLIGGPAGRPVIVFANSLGTDFRIWRDVVVRLAGDFPIVTYDKRGHGLSDLGQVPYSASTTYAARPRRHCSTGSA